MMIGLFSSKEKISLLIFPPSLADFKTMFFLSLLGRQGVKIRAAHFPLSTTQHLSTELFDMSKVTTFPQQRVIDLFCNEAKLPLGLVFSRAMSLWKASSLMTQSGWFYVQTSSSPSKIFNRSIYLLEVIRIRERLQSWEKIWVQQPGQ